MNLDHIRRVLRAYQASELPIAHAQRAAVLILLRSAGAGLELVLTRRSVEVRDHVGQVAFPGGRIEDSDADPTAAALREAHEELGVDPHQVEILGRIDDLLTITGYHIVPIVGHVPDGTALIPNPSEVARVFTIPLSVVTDRTAWEQRPHRWRGNEFLVWHLPYAGEDIWGVTAFMLRCLVDLL